MMQALGAAPGLSIGAGVIGDIFRLEERGGALGIYFAVGVCLDPHRSDADIMSVRRFLLDQP
jgi:MFS family permease